MNDKTDETNRLSGAAIGFDPRHALRVRTELRRQFQRRGTWVILLLLLVIPIALAAVLQAGRNDFVIEGDVIGLLATTGAGNFTVVTLYSGCQLFLIVVVAYLFGDALARESAWGYLRVLATVPVGRTRLLLVKATALAVIVVVAVVIYAVSSYLVGWAFFGAGTLLPVAGPGVTGVAVIGRVALMVGFIVVYLSWIAALALLLSVLAADNAAVAVTGTVTITVGFHVLGGLGALGNLRGIFPTRHYAAWIDASRAVFDPTPMMWGIFLSLLYATLLLTAALVAINVRDIRR
ncbi:ABC transporter permease subunit [Gordonia sp. ABSL1-1]|uniref:ABC transporter permease n=1 Tax=Gordonia sp. ABSL1-1 TaxID=3053923 RepID=UPI0025732878|nr:ABC transporter permease [Gordonia sp. ABSL1-1]MDL9935448.1 ABC transporter permease subunit [Gordonia sp. ABSL1-1]